MTTGRRTVPANPRSGVEDPGGGYDRVWLMSGSADVHVLETHADISGKGIMNFKDVIDILDKSVGGADADVASHGPFWRGVTRDRFVEMKLGGRKLVILGDGANSNLVLSLKGEAPFGSDLDEPPAGAVTPRMPAYLDPVQAGEIDDIVQWINDGCPAE